MPAFDKSRNYTTMRYKNETDGTPQKTQLAAVPVVVVVV